MSYQSYGPIGLNIPDNKVQLFLPNNFHSFVYYNKYFANSIPEHSSLITLNNDLSFEKTTRILASLSSYIVQNDLIYKDFEIPFFFNDIFYPLEFIL